MVRTIQVKIDCSKIDYAPQIVPACEAANLVVDRLVKLIGYELEDLIKDQPALEGASVGVFVL